MANMVERIHGSRQTLFVQRYQNQTSKFQLEFTSQDMKLQIIAKSEILCIHKDMKTWQLASIVRFKVSAPRIKTQLKIYFHYHQYQQNQAFYAFTKI